MRKKVLWVDDQIGVARTFSSALSSLGLDLVFAPDGYKAIERLEKEHFDLVLLDLRMPPGEWGGLWLLRTLKERQLRANAVVISGEGSQSETIDALRLGALDYVRKERIGSELADRLRATLDKINSNIREESLSRLPSPIAFPARLYWTSASAAERLRRMLECAESVFRLAAIVGLVEHASLAHGPLPSDLQFGMSTAPSMGTWNEIRNHLGDLLPRAAILGRINTCVESEFASSLVKMRNQFAHGRSPSDGQAEKILTEYEVTFVRMLSALCHRLNFEIFAVTSLAFEGGRFRVTGRSIIGDSPILPTVEYWSAKPLENHLVYLRGTLLDLKFLSMHPLVCASNLVEGDAWELFVFDGSYTRRKSGSTIADEPLRFIELWSGRRGRLAHANVTLANLAEPLKLILGLERKAEDYRAPE